MRRGLVVSFSESGRDGPGVHRIRNWAEALLVDIQRRGWGTVENPDTATDTVWVLTSSRRTMGDLTKAVLRTLRHANLLADAVVTRFADTSDTEEP